MESVHQFFGLDSPASVQWAHAVNSTTLLQNAMTTQHVHMLEADLIFVEGIPVMAHGTKEWAQTPETEKISFRVWLSTVMSWNESNPHKFGIKLDWKDSRAVGPSLTLLKESEPQCPTFLNADIMTAGANIDSDTRYSEWKSFTSTCQAYPKGILSIGWVTNPLPGSRYTHLDVDNMLSDINNNSSCNQHFTFPLRAEWILLSWDPLMRLLCDPRNFSFTIWGKIDHLTRSRLKSLLPRDRVFYDVQTPDVTHWKLIDEKETSLSQDWCVFRPLENSFIKRGEADSWILGYRCWLLSKVSHKGTPTSPLVIQTTVQFVSNDLDSRFSILVRTPGLNDNVWGNGNVDSGINCWLTRSGELRLSTHRFEPEEKCEIVSNTITTNDTIYLVTVEDRGVCYPVKFTVDTSEGRRVGSLEHAFPWRPEGGYVVLNTHERSVVALSMLSIQNVQV